MEKRVDSLVNTLHTGPIRIIYSDNRIPQNIVTLWIMTLFYNKLIFVILN